MSKVNEIKELIDKSMMNNEISNDDLLEIIKHAGAYGNLMKVSEYSKQNNITVQGVYKHRNVVELFGCKLVLDNY